jgi:hypothetical protein
MHSFASWVVARSARKPIGDAHDSPLGLTEEQLNRLHGPIGLEIGAGTPEEIAMSIMAEIVAARNNAID